jgi:hypothetical protein
LVQDRLGGLFAALAFLRVPINSAINIALLQLDGI